jgi:hypothetical protein
MRRISPNSHIMVDRRGFLACAPDEMNYGRENGCGYRIVTISGRTECVHRIVAQAFVHNPRPDIFDEVDHINHKRDDNRACNLRWVNKELNALNKVKNCIRTWSKFFNAKTKSWIFSKQLKHAGYYSGKRVTAVFEMHEEAEDACFAWRLQMFDNLYGMLTSGPVCAFFADESTGGRRSSRS